MKSARERILNQANYTVVGAGDSHMWGQGANGWADALTPKYVTGELRRLPGGIPTFLSLFEGYLAGIRSGIRTTKVINSGYGSTCTTKYLDSFWNEKVIDFKPDLVILEFAINDWLEDNHVCINEYKNNLVRMASDVISLGGDVILLTVSPIQGNQFRGAHYYEDYIGASREVACSDSRIMLADANLMMKVFLDAGNREENERLLYSDVWHVAQKGQELYFESIVEALKL